jgi:hypothetical protein
LRTVESAQRLLETAAIETLALENSIQRNRTLISAASVPASSLRLVTLMLV